MNTNRFLTILGFILFGIFSRCLPHPPNFTAINAIALFSAYFLGNVRLSLFVVFTSMFLSDFIFGSHSSLPFVYLSFGLITLMGHWLNSEKALNRLPFFLVGSSILFFVITNFGVWLTNPLYPKTLTGLGLCYFAAIPFLSYQVLGDITYALVMFGGFALAEKFIPQIRLITP